MTPCSHSAAPVRGAQGAKNKITEEAFHPLALSLIVVTFMQLKLLELVM